MNEKYNLDEIRHQFYLERAQHVCPVCKETKSHAYYKKNQNNDSIGIDIVGSFIVSPDKLKRKLYKIIKYKCKSCGATWQSDPIPENIFALYYEKSQMKLTSETKNEKE